MRALTLGIDATQAKAGAQDFQGATRTVKDGAREAALAVRELSRDITAQGRGITVLERDGRVAFQNIGRAASLLGPAAGRLAQFTATAEAGAGALASISGGAAAAGTSIAGMTGIGLVVVALAGGMALAADAVTDAAEASAKLDEQLAFIATRSDAAANGIGRVKQIILDLNIATGVGRDQLAALAVALSEAKLQENPAAYGVAVRASQAGLGTPLQAYNRLKGASDAIGLEATIDNLEKLGDISKSVTDRVGGDAQRLLEAMQQTGGVAVQLGQPISEYAAAVALAASATGDAVGEGEAYVTLLRKAKDPADDFHKYLERIGKGFVNGELQAGQFNSAIRAFGEEMKQSPELRNYVETAFPRSTRNYLALLTADANKLDGALIAATDSSGALADAQSRTANTITAQIARASAGWEAFKNQVGARLFPLEETKLRIGQLYNRHTDDGIGDTPIDAPGQVKNPADAILAQFDVAVRNGDFGLADKLAAELARMVKDARAAAEQITVEFSLTGEIVKKDIENRPHREGQRAFELEHRRLELENRELIKLYTEQQEVVDKDGNKSLRYQLPRKYFDSSFGAANREFLGQEELATTDAAARLNEVLEKAGRKERYDAITDGFKGIEKAARDSSLATASVELPADKLQREIQRTVAALDKQLTLSPNIEVLPDDIAKARETLTALGKIPEAKLLDKEKKGVADAADAVKRYTDTLRGAGELRTQLSARIADGFERESLAIDEALAQARDQIDVLREQKKDVTDLEALAEKAAAADRQRLEFRKQTAVDSSRAGELAAIAAQIDAKAQLERSTGNVVAAERLEADGRRATAEAARAQALVEQRTAEEAAGGNVVLRLAILATNAARVRSIQLTEQAGDAAAREVRQQRELAGRRAESDIASEFLSGIDQEVLGIQRATKARQVQAFEEARAGKFTNDSVFRQIVLLGALGVQQKELARTAAAQDISSVLAQSARAAARNFGEQTAAERVLLDVERQRVRLQLELQGATKAQLAAFDEYTRAQDQALARQARLNAQFGATNVGELVVEPGLRFDLATVDLQIRSASEPILRRLEDAFANPDLSADDLVREIERARAALDTLDGARRLAGVARNIGDSFSEQLGRVVLGFEKGGDAARAFARSVVEDLLNQIALRPIANALSGVANGVLGSLGIPGLSPVGAASGGAGPHSLIENARGNAYIDGEVVPFARGGALDRGQIYDSPTHFPLGGGKTGLLGEANPELILQAVRGPGGFVGVKSYGGGGEQSQTREIHHHTTHVTMVVNTPNADSFRKSQRQITDDLKRKTRR